MLQNSSREGLGVGGGLGVVSRLRYRLDISWFIQQRNACETPQRLEYGVLALRGLLVRGS